MEAESEDLDKYMLELVDLMSEDRKGVRCDKFWKWKLENEGY